MDPHNQSFSWWLLIYEHLDQVWSSVWTCVYRLPTLLRDLGVFSAPSPGPRGSPLWSRKAASSQGAMCSATFALTATRVADCLLLLHWLLVMWPCILSENDLAIHCLVPRNHERLSLEWEWSEAIRLQWGMGGFLGARLWGSSPHRGQQQQTVCLSLQLAIIIYR